MNRWYKLVNRGVLRPIFFFGGLIVLGFEIAAAVTLAIVLWRAWDRGDWHNWDWVPDPSGPPSNGASKKPEKVAEAVVHEK